MHALSALGSEEKRKACINFTQMNLFSKRYCNGYTLPHNWNLWTYMYVIILVQCNFFMIFQSIAILVHYHNKLPKFVCNVIDLCTTKGQIIKIVWSFPLNNLCSILNVPTPCCPLGWRLDKVTHSYFLSKQRCLLDWWKERDAITKLQAFY